MIAALVRAVGRWATGFGRAVTRWFRSQPPEHPQPAVQLVELTGEEAEKLLSAALLSGAIERAEYQSSLETLARADDARHPLEVPPA